METENTNQQAPPVQNIEQSQPAPPPNPPSHSKILIIITSVILLAMIGVGTYVLATRKNQTVVQNNQISISPTISQPSPTTTPPPFVIPTTDPSITANWKIYTNNAYGFEFKYPPTYEFESENADSVTFSGTYGDNQKIPSQLTLNFNPTIDSGILKKCGEAPVAGEYKCLTDPISETVINGIKFKEIHILEGSGDAMGSAKYIVQTIDKPTLEFVRLVLGGGVENHMKQILSTFQFTP